MPPGLAVSSWPPFPFMQPLLPSGLGEAGLGWAQRCQGKRVSGKEQGRCLTAQRGMPWLQDGNQNLDSPPASSGVLCVDLRVQSLSRCPSFFQHMKQQVGDSRDPWDFRGPGVGARRVCAVRIRYKES